jgi:hypothetical protein
MMYDYVTRSQATPDAAHDLGFALWTAGLSPVVLVLFLTT